MKRARLTARIERVERAHRDLRDKAKRYTADQGDHQERWLLEAAREYSAAMRALARAAP